MDRNCVCTDSDSLVISHAYHVIAHPHARVNVPEFKDEQQKLFDLILEEHDKRAKKNHDERN